MSDIYADINDDQPRKLFDAAGSFGTPARFDKVLASATDAQLKYKDEHKHTLLMRLQHHHDWPEQTAAVIERMKDFIGYGVHATDAHDDTALHFACAYGRTEAEKVLREHGADGTMPNKFGATANSAATGQTEKSS